MKLIMRLIRIMAFISVMAMSAFAADIKEYLDGPTGVSVKLNVDGTIKSIVASGESQLIFGDKKDEQADIQKATLQATLLAKAKISKFMSESLPLNEVMDDLTIIASDAASDGKTAMSSSITRQTLEIQRGIIWNSSDDILNGLVVLTTETVRDKKYIKVVLGTDDKLMLASALSAAHVPTPVPESAAAVVENDAPAVEKKAVKKAKKGKKVKTADSE